MDETSFEYEDQDQGQPRAENNTIKTESNRVYKGSVSPPTADVSSYQYKPFRVLSLILLARKFIICICICICICNCICIY
jgi:hypothetical protein